MPRGVPTLNSDPTAPKSEVLGTIKDTLTDPTPQGAAYVGGTVDLTEPPPPWEVDEKSHLALSDARRFVEVPDNWELRWINPKLLDQLGWRYWQPVMASDERVTVHVQTMVSPEGNIRRGGATGDLLAWMYKSWVESRRREQQKATADLTQSAMDRQAQLREDINRGRYGPGMRIEHATHPTHTIGDGRSMTDA